MKDEFYSYLKDEEKKTENTCKSYTYQVGVVCKGEGYTWQELANHISTVVSLYDIGGRKENLGNIGHRTRISALKAFQNFVTAKKHKWSFEENFICCVLYIQTYIIKKKNTSVSDLIKTAIPLLPGFSGKDPTNTLRQKFQNIKAIAASKNLTDTFPSDERPNASTENKIAFEKAYDILI